MYMFRYKDAKGVRRCLYSWRLTQTDKIPKGKRSTERFEIRRKERSRIFETALTDTRQPILRLTIFLMNTLP